MGRSHHSMSWRVGRAIESASFRQPLITRTGPAVMFGLMGVVAEIMIAPVVLGLTFVVGLASYLALDTPRTHMRAQQRPRFVSVRILYLNTLIVAGFWLAVMFTFSAADPTVSNGVQQRLPALLEVATAHELRTLVLMKEAAFIAPVNEIAGPASTWFDVFLHGLVSALSLNFLLYAVVIARRRLRARHTGRGSSRTPIRYDAALGLFVDEDSAAPR